MSRTADETDRLQSESTAVLIAEMIPNPSSTTEEIRETLSEALRERRRPSRRGDRFPFASAAPVAVVSAQVSAAPFSEAELQDRAEVSAFSDCAPFVPVLPL